MTQSVLYWEEKERKKEGKRIKGREIRKEREGRGKDDKKERKIDRYIDRKRVREKLNEK